MGVKNRRLFLERSSIPRISIVFLPRSQGRCRTRPNLAARAATANFSFRPESHLFCSYPAFPPELSWKGSQTSTALRDKAPD